MAIFTQAITATDVLAGLTTDSTKWAGANIANLDTLLSTLMSNVETYVKCYTFLNNTETWTQSVDGTVDYYFYTQPLSTGTWYMRLTWTTNGNSGDTAKWKFLYQDSDNYVEMCSIDSNNANGCNVRKVVATVQTTLIQRGTNNTGTDEHYYETIRDLAGNMSLERDGVSVGTAQDTFLPTLTSQTIYEFLDSAGGSVVELDEVKYTRD